MNKALKVDKILNAWLEYIALDDYSKAAVSPDAAKLRGIELQGNRVFIEQTTFLEIQKNVNTGQSGQQETAWALSFPLIRTQDEDKQKYYLRPLFSLDVTSILKGRYQAEGWNIDDLKLAEAGENLAQFFKLDDEEREQLKIQDGLRHLLNSKFGLDFEETYETWIKVVALPHSYQIKDIKRQPYLFEFQGNGFSKNLKKDLEKIKTSSRYWLKQRHPAYEYLFGEPTQPEEEDTYFGAFPTDPPTTSQLEVLKQAKSQPMTAVQGPPGSGKTTLIVHLIAQQVVKRALRLIETGEDINNLTIVSSTNNKAVDNVIEKLKQEAGDRLFYLEGGNKREKIEKFAKNQLKDSLDYLEKGVFEEARLASLSQEITIIKDELSEQQNNYLQLRHQRDDDNQRKPYLLEKLQALKIKLETENTALIPFF
ncbi:AAA domain-containing protein [Microcoleus sp. D2_18a_D3]|uniref:AAA domain-containing protein n=1 Tax=Microcoleus sp. D2_18a_D3 TaxID=3055330 RepID=UPI002FD56516